MRFHGDEQRAFSIHRTTQLTVKSLELKIPPPVLGVIVAALMVIVAYCRFTQIGNPWNILSAILCGVIGAAFGLPSMSRFRKAGTTITPTHPEKASQLVHFFSNTIHYVVLMGNLEHFQFMGLAVWL